MTDMQNGSQEKHPSTTENPNDLPNTNGHPPSPINSEPDSSKPLHGLLLDADHAQSNGATFDDGPPSKRRKTADIATTETPLTKLKPPSPPWKKFETEGPSTFEENGKRKSARTNRIPLDLQPPADKRQTRAKLQKSTQLPKSKYSGASQYETKSGAASSLGNGKKLTGYGKSSIHAPSESSYKTGLRNGAKNQQPQLNLTPVKRAYKKRVPSTNGHSSTDAPSGASPHQTRRTARTLDSSERGVKNGGKPTDGYGHTSEVSERATDEDGSDEDDEEVDSDSDVVMGDNYKPQRLNLRVKLPSLSVQHPDQVVRARRFPSFKDWFEAEGSKDPDAPARKPHDYVQAEANFRRKILEEAQPGGLLSKEKSTVYAPEKQEEPPRQWAHYDHVIAHHHNFRLLLRKEHETHRKAAKALANEAAELWRSRQPKTEEEIWQELKAQSRAVYRQVQKDLQNKWDMVKAEAERRRLKEWEEEQQMLGKEALNKVLEQSTQLLDKRRRRSSTSAAGSDDDRSPEERDNTSASDEVSGESQDEANMSTQSESDDGSADNDAADGDEKLTREELIRKYARVKSPSIAKSPVLAKSETHIHDPGGAEAPTHPMTDDNVMTPTSAVLSSQPVMSPADVDEVDEVLMDDSGDSTDMEDDMGDSDDDRSSVSEKSGDDSDASEGNTGLLGFITQKELLAAQEQLEISPTQPQREVEAAPIPDAAQVQTPSASNSEELATETLEAVLAKETSEQSPLQHMMNVDSVDHSHEDSLPTTPVSTKPLRTPVPSLLRGTLREYQHFGLDWLAGLYANGTNGILADEMGLGKTIQTISLLAHLAVEHEIWGPHLIVVPTSVMLNWEMEFKKFLPGFKVLTYYGTQEERKQKRQGWISNSDKWNVWITSYQLALKDDQVFKRREWQFMVLDEAHNIKNFRSKRWQTLLTFNTRARLLLTGTPLQNNLTELWSLLFFLMPADSASTGIGRFADLQEFSNWFRKPVEQILEHGRDTMDDEAKAIVTKLHKVLRPYLLRRLKADVEKQMPGKYEHVVYCRLSKRQRYLYDGFMSRAQTRETLASGNYLSIINCLMQLRKVCNHPDLFETRQIVTSFAMPKSAVADFEIKELLVRRRLLHEQPMTRVDLNVINLLPGSNEQPSALDTIQKQRLGALGTLRQLTSQQWGRIDQSVTFDGRTVKSTLIHMENAARRARFEELRHAAYLTSLRSQRRPLYSNSLVDRLTLGPNRLPMGRRPQRRADLSNWWTESSSVLAAMVPTLPERSYAMETTIQKFACVTPAVAASDLAPLVLSRKGVEAVRNVQRVYPDDPLHEARMRLSIAFPDKRLLQYDCGKLQRLDSLLRNLQSGGHRALIFTQMTKVLDILEQFLNIHGHRYLRLDGQTKIEQRQILTERFNNDPRILVFILSSRSGGLGINLTGADSVIFYDLDWNPAMDKQCQDRCHRIGQTRDVHIYRFVSEHTIEANILRKANQKRMLDDVVIQEGEFTTDYFNKVGPKDVFEDEGYSGDAEADAAMDRVLGGRITGKVFEQVEDQEDIVAARNAEKELVQTDAADFDEKAVPGNGDGATPKTSGPPTPGELMPPPSSLSKRVEQTTTLDTAQSGLATPAAGLEAGGEEEEEEEEGASVEEYMLRLVQWEVKDVPVQPAVDKSKKKSKKGAEHGIRKR